MQTIPHDNLPPIPFIEPVFPEQNGDDWTPEKVSEWVATLPLGYFDDPIEAEWPSTPFDPEAAARLKALDEIRVRQMAFYGAMKRAGKMPSGKMAKDLDNLTNPYFKSDVAADHKTIVARAHKTLDRWEAHFSEYLLAQEKQAAKFSADYRAGNFPPPSVGVAIYHEDGSVETTTAPANSMPAHPKQSEPLPLIFFDEARNAPVQRYHIKGFIAEGATSSVFAHPKKMKSTIVTDAGVHLAAGKEDWRGHRIREAKGVVYFAFERHIQVRQALTAYAIRDGLENLPFAIVPRLVNMLDPGCVELIKNAIDRVQQRFGIEVALSVFDTWNKGIAAGGGNEDKAEHQNAAAANLRRLIEQLPALHCLSIGHAGKELAKGERGSNATEGDRRRPRRRVCGQRREWQACLGSGLRQRAARG
jgi:hypothetical protein